MQKITKTFRLILFVFVIGLCTNVSLNAQTPADDPGIGGPGTSGAAPAVDGAPIVPFDSNLNLLFGAIVVLFVADNLKKKRLIVVE